MKHKKRATTFAFVTLSILCVGLVASCVQADQAQTSPEDLPPAKQTYAAANPTPTTIPSIGRCPLSQSACDQVSKVQSVLADSRRLDELFSDAKPLKIICSDTLDNPALIDSCAAGGDAKTVEGYYLLTKLAQFVVEDRFREVVSNGLREIPEPRVVKSVGCASVVSTIDGACTDVFAVGIVSEAVPDGPAIVLFYKETEVGPPSLTGAVVGASAAGPVSRGGPQDVGVVDEARGTITLHYIWFQPIR